MSTDVEITALCAEALGWKHLGAVGIEPPKRGEPDPKGLWCLSGANDWWESPEGWHVCGPCQGIPDPLNDDEDAMALVRKLHLQINPPIKGGARTWWVHENEGVLLERSMYGTADENLNRAICECVAKMQKAMSGATNETAS